MKEKRIVSQIRSRPKPRGPKPVGTDWQSVAAMGEKEIMAAAKLDPDAQPTDLEFWKDAKLVLPMEISNNDQLFVERRPQGGYAVRKPNSERASDILPTQAEAIERARELNPGKAPLVERVRHTTGGKPDKWRKP